MVTWPSVPSVFNSICLKQVLLLLSLNSKLQIMFLFHTYVMEWGVIPPLKSIYWLLRVIAIIILNSQTLENVV